MYVVTNEDEDDKTPQAFLHSLNRDNRTPKPNLVEAAEAVKNTTKHVARFGGISQQKESYRVVISTYYNGKEIVETYHELICRPLPPSSLTSAQWHFVINEHDINFKIGLEWEANKDHGCSYLVDLMENENSIFEVSPISVASNSCSHTFADNREDETKNLVAKIWTVKNGKEPLRSYTPLVITLPELPIVMKNYAKYVKENIFKEISRKASRHNTATSSRNENDHKAMSAYSFRVALLQQVAEELKKLHEDLQLAATFSREKVAMQKALSEHDNKMGQCNQSITNSIGNKQEAETKLTTASHNGEDVEEMFINDLNVAE